MKRRNNEKFLWFTTALGGQIGCHLDKIKSLSDYKLTLMDGRKFRLAPGNMSEFFKQINRTSFE